MKNLNLNKEITVVIVLYKDPEELIVKTLTQINNFKIIIIDNDANLELKKKITSKFSIERYILNNSNNGFSAGYNQGIKLSNTKFTLVLGPDCLILEEDINKLLLKLFEYKNALIVSPTSYDEFKNLTYAGGPLPENGEKNIVLKIEGDTCVESTLGACMLFRTDDIINNDLLFDENFFLYFSDDDLCRRIKSLKKTTVQVFDAKCIHQHGILKVKNKFLKIFIREYNYTFDKFYYFFKVKKHEKLISSFKKRIPNYIIRFFIKFLIFKISDSVSIFSRLYAYYKFKSKFIR